MLSCTISFRQVLSQRIKLETKRELLGYVKELTEIIHGPAISIKEESKIACPKCGVITNIKPDNKLYRCLSCGEEFTDARAVIKKNFVLRSIGSESTKTITRYDETDLRKRIVEMSPFVTPLTIFHADQTLYVNIIQRYGAIEKGFASVGMVYANPALEEWQTSIINYLGILTDGQIAKIVQRSTQTVASYRQRLGIASASENLLGVAITKEAVEEIREVNKERLLSFYQVFSTKSFPNLRRMAKEVIEKHSDKSDEEIIPILVDHGIKIARRTVNKYRHQIRNEQRLLKNHLFV